MYFPVSALLIEFMILSIVNREDSYGYEISQTIKLVADIKESTLYPILTKLEKAGYVTTYSAEYQGRKRKYYSITEAGKIKRKHAYKSHILTKKTKKQKRNLGHFTTLTAADVRNVRDLLAIR